MSEIQDIVAQYTELPDHVDAPLELDSLDVVSLVEDLEEAFGLVVRPSEVVPANFGTLLAIEAFVQARR